MHQLYVAPSIHPSIRPHPSANRAVGARCMQLAQLMSRLTTAAASNIMPRRDIPKADHGHVRH